MKFFDNIEVIAAVLQWQENAANACKTWTTGLFFSSFFLLLWGKVYHNNGIIVQCLWQTKFQGHAGAVKHVVVSVPHTVSDNDQLPHTGKLLMLRVLCGTGK